MNDQTTHTDWHPNDTPEYVQEAIARVRERLHISDILERTEHEKAPAMVEHPEADMEG